MFGSKPTVQIVVRSLKHCKDCARFQDKYTKPFSFLTKELVEDWQDRGIWEEVGLVELSDLDASVGSHVQVDMVTPIQEILLSALGHTCYQLIAQI